jgi:hypothetical protein
LFPGLPSIIFSSLTAFFGGILRFAYERVKTSRNFWFDCCPKTDCANCGAEEVVVVGLKRCFVQRLGRSSSDVVADEG